MTTKIGLLGDVHATVDPVAEALAIFRDEGVDRVWCAGDVAGYSPFFTYHNADDHHCKAYYDACKCNIPLCYHHSTLLYRLILPVGLLV